MPDLRYDLDFVRDWNRVAGALDAWLARLKLGQAERDQAEKLLLGIDQRMSACLKRAERADSLDEEHKSVVAAQAILHNVALAKMKALKIPAAAKALFERLVREQLGALEEIEKRQKLRAALAQSDVGGGDTSKRGDLDRPWKKVQSAAKVDGGRRPLANEVPRALAKVRRAEGPAYLKELKALRALVHAREAAPEKSKTAAALDRFGEALKKEMRRAEKLR